MLSITSQFYGAATYMFALLYSQPLQPTQRVCCDGGDFEPVQLQAAFFLLVCRVQACIPCPLIDQANWNDATSLTSI